MSTERDVLLSKGSRIECPWGPRHSLRELTHISGTHNVAPRPLWVEPLTSRTFSSVEDQGCVESRRDTGYCHYSVYHDEGGPDPRVHRNRYRDEGPQVRVGGPRGEELVKTSSSHGSPEPREKKLENDSNNVSIRIKRLLRSPNLCTPRGGPEGRSTVISFLVLRFQRTEGFGTNTHQSESSVLDPTVHPRQDGGKFARVYRILVVVVVVVGDPRTMFTSRNSTWTRDDLTLETFRPGR